MPNSWPEKYLINFSVYLSSVSYKCVCMHVYIYDIYIIYFTYILKYIKTYTSIYICMFKIYVYFKFIYPYICIYAYMKLKKTVYSTFILVFEDLSWTPFNSINILLQHHFLPSFSSFLFFFLALLLSMWNLISSTRD